jgi:hypothetical protein
MALVEEIWKGGTAGVERVVKGIIVWDGGLEWRGKNKMK